VKLSEKLDASTILYPLQSNSKEQVLHELLDHFINLKYLTSCDKLFKYLKDDDQVFNSASGRGIAYHYHTSIEVSDTTLVLGISEGGIDYSAPDGLLCHFILLILEPINKPNSHRVIINIFQDLIKNSNIKSKILEVNSPQEIEEIIQTWEMSNEEDDLI
tara:strand:- start:465 stop:944 length:480 start_codon:yes stop_codon:yes gene_type:complete